MYKFVIPNRMRHIGEGGIDLNQVAKFISENSKDENVTKFLNTIRPINEDVVKAFLESDEAGKKFAVSFTDRRVNEAIKTHDEKFTKEKLPTIEAQLREQLSKELNVKETPDQKVMREQKERLDKLEKDYQREKIRNQALELINENKLPFAKLVDKFIGEDLESTAANIEAFKAVWDTEIAEAVKKKMAEDNGRSPDSRGDKKPEPLETQLENAKKAGNLLEQIRIKNLIAEKKTK